MKNKNIKNKPQKCGRWLFLHSRFSKSFFNNNSQRQKKKKKKESRKALPQLKQSTRKLSLGYTEIEKKRKRALGQDLFLCDLFIGLFETLVCSIAEDNVCDSCIVSF